MVLRGMIMDQANIPFQNGCRCEQNHWSVHLSVCDLVLWAGVAVEEEMTCEQKLWSVCGVRVQVEEGASASGTGGGSAVASVRKRKCG